MKPQIMTEAFLASHPYQLSDGRRFRTLRCAGHCIQHNYSRLDPVRHVPTGFSFTSAEARQAYAEGHCEFQEAV